MELDELLSELRENILHDRSDRVSGPSDYLWTDATLIRYIDEAQRRFARIGMVIRDAGNPSVTQVTLQTGVSEYPLHKAILGIVSAKLTDDDVDLRRAGHSLFDAYRTPDFQIFDTASVTARDPGKPMAYSTDETVSATSDGAMGRVTIRVYPAPSSDYDGDTIDLRVVRLPVERLTAANLKASPEIPEEYHIEMLDWAAYLAFRIADVDAGSMTRAEKYMRTFEAHAGRARSDTIRKLFVPNTWGFGQNGFAWEH